MYLYVVILMQIVYNIKQVRKRQMLFSISSKENKRRCSGVIAFSPVPRANSYFLTGVYGFACSGVSFIFGVPNV